jgi:predicted N-acetyltransferase YhbS
MPITYQLEPDLSAEAFREVLVASSLGERRPVNDLARLEAMLRNADVVATARDGARLVGVSRAITDFVYCCYLSDLAVDAAYQRQGVGQKLIEETRRGAGGEQVTLLLVAAPAAEGYYPKIGFNARTSWNLPRTR